ncbi:hypothetical protein [Sporosarcina sp. E16_8]|uniref:hypothetical protein n=1 Tax=Sporosarcina sp. E16_8 TaxID=2789295 RepID=UPI001A9251B5|nr:hypothetical protein [Sporosarcina sp. E16_8]MBO0587448.1 hypothetical protein [Sporosarcina sp. E16_8]
MSTSLTAHYNSHPLKFREEIRSRSILSVPIQDILYRANNHRFQVAVQERVVNSGGKYTMYTLKQDIARPEVQAMIHQVLQASVGEDGKALKVKLIDEKQTTPLVLAVGNVVVNGNTRLFIMRILLAIDPFKYAHFSNVRCIYLPDDATEEEIDEYEIEEQLAEEVKVEYLWYETANWMLEWKTQHNKSNQQVADKFRIGKSEAKKLMDSYSEADLYLRHINKPFQFKSIEKKRTAFETLSDVKTKFASDPAKQKLIEQIAYYYIQNEDAVPERLFIYFQRISSHIDTIEKSLIEHGPKIEVGTPNEANNHNPDSDIEDLFCSESQGTEAVLDYFTQLEGENRKEAIEIVDRVIEHETDKEKEKQRKAKPLMKLQQGLDAIQESYVHFNNKEQDAKKLAQVIAKIEKTLTQFKTKLGVQ